MDLPCPQAWLRTRAQTGAEAFHEQSRPLWPNGPASPLAGPFTAFQRVEYAPISRICRGAAGSTDDAELMEPDVMYSWFRRF
jgi:hypothetical protein